MHDLSDFERGGRKFQFYIMALDHIVTQFSYRFPLGEKNGVMTMFADDLTGLLKDIWGSFREATESEMAFIADDKGRIILTVPEHSLLNGKPIPTNLFDTATKSDRIADSLVLYRLLDSSPQFLESLNKLDIDSLFSIRLDTALGRWYVGLCNGGGAPPFLSEDQKFIEYLMTIFTELVNYGHEVAEGLKWKDYLRARHRGDWGYLGRASENLAACMTHHTKEVRENARP